ncbi:HU family DNA-binding protein [Pseudorhodobacter aquimaris]|uniref:HU family DNA-binding protein n=1 Tax=Pseudorhodobacter aquimaris TaxID=687412 RepID=UPI00067A7FD5|nr:HU family DNA-binding protein [Pseudorhodobacter aquimaris]
MAPKAQSTVKAAIAPAAVVVPTVSVHGSGNADTPKVADTAADQPHMLKKQEMVERVVKATGAKKKDVKLILEASLGVLGDALSAGEVLNIPPLGKMKVNRQKTEGGSDVLILKLRRPGAKTSLNNQSKEGLAAKSDKD